MYWLRWHYHVKDIAGAPYKIKQKREANKTTESPTVSSREQTTVILCSTMIQSRSPSYCQTTTGKVQSSARDGTSSATVYSWQTTAGCSTHVPKPLWEGTVTECWKSAGRYHQHGWVSRAQTTSSVDVRCPVLFHEDSDRPERTAGMWLAPELSTNGVDEAYGVRYASRWENQTGGGIQDGLQLVLQLAGDTSENRVAVVHLADNQCTNQGQQGMSWQRSLHAPDLT